MRFIVDEQLSPGVAEWLKSKGHEADHIRTLEGLQTTDRRIVDLAVDLNAIIVSKDADFAELLGRAASGLQLVRVRIGNTQNRVLIARLESEWPRIERELAAGARIVELT